MGEFDLREPVSLKGAECITGINPKNIEVIAQRIPGFSLVFKETVIILDSRKLVEFILNQRDGKIGILYKPKRRFTDYQYKQFEAYSQVDILSVDGVNFPLIHSYDFVTLPQFCRNYQKIVDMNCSRLQKEITPALEERMFSDEVLRYSCYKTNVISYHPVDLTIVAEEVFGGLLESRLNSREEYDMPWWFSKTQIMKLLEQRGQIIIPTSKTKSKNIKRIENIISMARHNGRDIPYRNGRNETIYWIDETALDFLANMNELINSK